jgi:hypothetical protein
MCDHCKRIDGKLLSVDIAIDQGNPDRIVEWPKLRALMRARFGSDLSNNELFERLQDWLIVTRRIDEQTANNFAIADVIEWLRNESSEPSTNGHAEFPGVMPDMPTTIVEKEPRIQGRKGRLPKQESAVLQARFLAELREHPTMVDDPAKIAAMVGVSESTARRWIDEFRAEHNRRKQPEDDEE